MPNYNKLNYSLSLDELRDQIDVVRSKTTTLADKQTAEGRLKAHFWIKFENDEYVNALFTKLVDGEAVDRDRQTIYLAFKSDFDKLIHEAIAIFIENIKKENFENNHPEAYFKAIVRNKLVNAYRKQAATIDKKLKEAIKQAAKGQPTIKDFYKNFTTFLSILHIKNQSEPEADAYETELFEDFSPEDMQSLEKSIKPFKNINNLDMIWSAIEKENHRCFYDQKCVLCESADTCLKHQIMIKNKEGGVPYHELVKETPFKSIRELMSRRTGQIQSFYNKLIKTNNL